MRKESVMVEYWCDKGHSSYDVRVIPADYDPDPKLCIDHACQFKELPLVCSQEEYERRVAWYALLPLGEPREQDAPEDCPPSVG